MRTIFYKQTEVCDGFNGSKIVVYLCEDPEAGIIWAVCPFGFYVYSPKLRYNYYKSC